jgi:hypothetical protein
MTAGHEVRADDVDARDYVATVLQRVAQTVTDFESTDGWAQAATDLIVSLLAEAGGSPFVLSDGGGPVAVVGVVGAGERASSLALATSVLDTTESLGSNGWGSVAALLAVASNPRRHAESWGALHLHIGICAQGYRIGSATTAILDSGAEVDAVIATGAFAGVPLQSTSTSPGVLAGRIGIRGKVTHCGNRAASVRPGGTADSVGVNALEKAAFLIEALHRLEDQWLLAKTHPRLPAASFTIGVTSLTADAGYPVPFYFPDRARIGIRVDYSPDESFEAVTGAIEAYVGLAARLDPWLQEHPPLFEWSPVSPAMDGDPGSRLSACLARAIESRRDPHSPPLDRAGQAFAGSEAPFYAARAIPAAIVGHGARLAPITDIRSTGIDEHLACAELLGAAASNWFGDHDAR